MLHDIAPMVFNNAFAIKEPAAEDFALCYSQNEILLTDEPLALPRFSDVGLHLMPHSEYLFSIDEMRFFLVRSALSATEIPNDCRFVPLSSLNTELPRWQAFPAHMGAQVFRWKNSHVYCGRCGAPMKNSDFERALVCSECGLVEYPKIAPAIIVAVTDGDRLLMTRYARNANAYRRYALVAGFVEIGETFEEAVQREVFEEVGLRIKNVTYYKSQPWPFPDSVMIGFFAELDGDDTITLQESELCEGVWFPREEIPPTQSTVSIAQELIEGVRSGINELCLELHRQRPIFP
ncbi:MAG: NAD(+) diphosphatase [Clostridia bacterium]|nr:NAD(+) diphosphatase [Clostridia bacterium]